MLLVKKIFDYFVWLMFFGLLLLGGVIYVTNRAYPGDYLYPFKLKFEGFALATSKILNKQVDFSIDLVVKRSNEATKILSSKYGKDGLNRLNIQVELTANSISQIADPIEKKKAAEKYIVKLNEVSSALSEKQKDFVVTPPTSNAASQAVTQTVAQPVQNIPTLPTEQGSQNIIPTITPSPEISTVSQQIDNTQETIKQTIDKMTDLATIPMKNNQQENKDNKSNNEKGEQKDKQNDQKNNNSDKETNDQEKNKGKQD